MRMPPAKSWKTTVSGIVLGVSIFVSSSGLDFPPWADKTLRGLMAVSAAMLGSTAKDSSVTGDPPKEVKD